MKILHIVESTATGTLSMLKLAANNQAENGDEVAVIYSKREETPKNISELFFGVRLINVQMEGFFSKFKAVFSIRKLIKDFSPDVVILHSSFGGFIGRIASLGVSGKFFYIPHCISFMRQDISSIKRMIFVFFERLASVKTSTYLACSNSEKNWINRYLPKISVRVLENAVDVSLWLDDNPWNERANRIVTVGQIRYQKDPARFASVASLLKKSKPGVEFVWVGDGDLNSRLLLESAGVSVVGWKNTNEISNILSGSKYYMSTSLWEGMPVSPIEAMLSGCVVLLSNCPGNVDIIVDKETGVIFDTPEEAVEKLLWLIDNDALSQKLAVSGSTVSRVKFAAERYLLELNQLIRE